LAWSSNIGRFTIFADAEDAGFGIVDDGRGEQAAEVAIEVMLKVPPWTSSRLDLPARASLLRRSIREPGSSRLLASAS